VSRRQDSPGEAVETLAMLGAQWTPTTAVITREILPGREPDDQQWSQRRPAQHPTPSSLCSWSSC